MRATMTAAAAEFIRAKSTWHETALMITFRLCEKAKPPNTYLFVTRRNGRPA